MRDRLTKGLKIAGTFLLVIMLSGCGLFQTTVVETRTEPVIPPESVRPDCPEIRFTGETVGDVLEFVEPLYKQYENCRSEVQSFDKWIMETKKQYEDGEE